MKNRGFSFAGSLDGIRLELANYEDGSHEDGKGKFRADDYLDIKDLAFNGEELEIDESEDGQSDHGVWNNTNTDHTLPTLEVIYL